MGYLIAALLIWASSLIAGKYSYAMFDPMLTVQCRLIISALIVLPFFRRSYRQIPSRLMPLVWLLAWLNFPVVLTLQFIGLYYTSASSAVTIIGTEPLLVVLMGHLFFKQRAARIDIVLGIVAFIGIALMMSNQDETQQISLFGCLLIFGAGLAFVICVLLGKKVMAEVKPQIYTNVILVLGMVMCIPFTGVLTQNWTITPNLTGIFSILYLGMGCSWLAMLLFNKGLERTSTAVSSILIALEPVFGVLFAIILLDEKLTWITGSGIALVLSATFLSVTLPTFKKRCNR